MAKDGTYRGGRRIKAGSKPDALADKIMKGAPTKRMELPDFTNDMTDFDVDDIGDGVELEGMDMPSPDDYLSALQKDGKPLTNLLTAKEHLIKKALGIDDLDIEVSEDTVSFPWFTEMPDPETVKAYTHFITALGKMSRDLKRISANEKEVANEKYAFRCFLLRLGFIGNEYKAERKILLKNLSGNSSWKNGAPKKEVAACE